MTMKENEMNESAKIRERFLANTREHFLIGGATTDKMQPTEHKGGKSCCCTSEQQRRQSGR